MLANDTDADPGDTLTITFVDTSGAVGTALINDKGTPSDPTDDVIDYTPQIGFSGTDSFSYTIQDMGGLSDTAAVTVTVNLGLAVDFNNYTIQSYGGGDLTPTAFAVEDGGMTLHLMGNTWKAIQLMPAYAVTADTVVEFDYMSDGSPAEINAIGLETQLVTPNAAITFAIYGTQTWGNRDFFGYGGGWQHYVIPVGAYYPAGDRAYLFLVNDADHGQNTSVRFRNVQIHEGAGGGNAAPVAQDDTFTVNEDTANTTLAVLLDNGNGPDSDLDGDPLNIVSVGLPDQGGTATINDNGTPGDPTDDVLIDYAPAANFVGIEAFTYTITDGALIDTAMVTVTVVNANAAAPVALDDTFTVLEDSEDNPLDVLANDTDADPGDTLTITFVDTSGTVGTALINNKGTPSDPTDDVIDYTPQTGFSGTDSFSYTIQDMGGLSDTATVTVTVNLAGGGLAVDFNDYAIQSYGGQDSAPTAFAVEDGGMTLHLMGNTWKAIQLTPAYAVTAETVVEFDFMSDGTYLAEINAIGLDTQPVALNAAITFAIYGTQIWGNRDFFGYGGGWQHYVIPVGAYYPAGDRAYLFLTNDADHGQNTSVRFSNVQIHE